MTLLDKYFKLDKAAKSNNNKGKHVCLVLKSDGKPSNQKAFLFSVYVQ